MTSFKPESILVNQVKESCASEGRIVDGIQNEMNALLNDFSICDQFTGNDEDDFWLN